MSAEFDISGRQFNFKKDLAYGHDGEMLIDGFFEAMSGGSVEVKSDRYHNGKMVVETNQNPRATVDSQGNKIWVKSGINITTATWWVYIFNPDGGFVIVSVARLKRFLRMNSHIYNEQTKRDMGGADNPAKGFLIEAVDVIKLLTKKVYDDNSL